MKDTVKRAFIRWISDLMKADNIIAISEIDYLETICKDFSISQLDIEKSIGLTLADACLALVTEATKKERLLIIEKLKALSLSDGACAREEALLILALSYCLGDDTKEKSRMVSFKSAHIDFVDSQVIFIEPHEDDEINNIIKSNIKHITNEMRIGGFDFIYIPSIAKHYRETNRELLYKIIKYLAPTLSDNETHNVLEVISNMSTKYFKNEILKEKFGINLKIKQPCLLIKIGNSYVNGEMMSDFLLLELGKDLISQIDIMIERFLEYQRCPTITIKNYIDSGDNFVYMGFYKTIFDLITYRKGARCSLIINPDRRQGRLQIMNENLTDIDLGLAETAFYVYLICESISKRKGVCFQNLGANSIKNIQKKYASIYSSFVGSRDIIPDITESNTRNRMLSVIRKAICENKELLEKHIYMPNTNTAKIFIPIEPQFIFIKEGKKDIPLLNSKFWKID